MTLNLNHFSKLQHKRFMLFIFDYSLNDAVNNLNDSATWLFRADYFHPEMWNKTMLQLGMLLSFLDTKLQKDTRGVEINMNPLVKVTRNFNDNMNIGLQYDFSKNISKDKNNFDYIKHVATVNFKLQF